MSQENERLAALRKYNILDTEAEDEFDNLVKLASRICDVPMAQINFVDRNRQWTKAGVGLESRDLPLSQSFCNHTIRQDRDVMIIPDTLEDERLRDNPLVKGEPGLRFYAGVVLSGLEGHALGSLCVLDTKPRTLTEEQLDSLRIVAREVEARMELRHVHRRLNEMIINNLPVNFFMYDEDMNIIRWNDNFNRSTGYSDEEIKEIKPMSYFRKEDRELIGAMIRKVFDEGEASVESNLLAKDGSITPYVFSASHATLGNKTYMIGTGQDISGLKKTQRALEKSLEEKEVMLTEIHHRVKNNLAIISGLIQMELMEGEFPGGGDDRLANTHLRILSMAKIHEVMYQNENFSEIKMKEVLPRIVEVVEGQYKERTGPMKFHHEFGEIRLNINQAIPCGLILNELLIETCKYASERGRGNSDPITVSAKQAKNRVHLRVKDSGRNAPVAGEGSGEGLTGLGLVRQLCRQLDGKLRITETDGTEFSVTFRKRKTRGAGSTMDLPES